MDLMTYALCKGNGGGGGLPTPELDGQILFSNSGDWIQEDIRNIASPLQEIWVNFDGESFSLDTTKTQLSELSLQKYKRTPFTFIYVNVSDTVFVFPAHLSFTNFFSKAIYQTSVIALDNIGLTGNVGYLWVDADVEGSTDVGLYYWPASSM